MEASRGHYAGDIQLEWISAGDNGATGKPYAYDVRYHSNSDINENNFDSLQRILSSEYPRNGGSRVSKRINLNNETYYCFALKTVDDMGLKSTISNISCTESGMEAPSQITDTQVIDKTTNSITISWTAPGDNGTSGTATEYDIRYNTSPIYPSNWDNAIQAENEPVPQPYGNTDTFTISGLQPGTVYYIGVKGIDDNGLAGRFSNIINTKTTDSIPPSALTTLTSEISNYVGTIRLMWIATGDNGTSGTADSYDVRYFSSMITNENWEITSRVKYTSTPLPSGSNQAMGISKLDVETTYYFGIKVIDDAGNISDLSNITSITTHNVSPAKTYDLKAAAGQWAAVNLSWTSSGDNYRDGTAKEYDIRYSKNPITATNFSIAQKVLNVPAPKAPSNTEQFELQGLDSETKYFFALKTGDTAGNWSEISNVPNTETTDGTPPGVIADLLAVTASIRENIILNWTAVGDSELEGRAESYEIRYSKNFITSSNFDSAELFENSLVPKEANSEETLTINGLQDEELYYFAIKTTDNDGNISQISNVASVFTKDVAPFKIGDLKYMNTGAGFVSVRFTATGDNENTGRAESYDIRYSLNTITESNWENTTQVQGEPAPGVSGTTENVTITGLLEDTEYYFAVKVTDDRNNESELSNVINAKTTDITAPAKITGLTVLKGNDDGSIVIEFLSTGDNGSEGKAESYDIRYSKTIITADNFDLAIKYTGGITPKESGSNEQVTVRGLKDETRYYAAVKAIDEAENESLISNVESSLTNEVAPSKIVDLRLTATTKDSLKVLFTATGDNKKEGKAAAYDIRYSTAAITGENFETALQVNDEPEPKVSGSLENYELKGLSDDTVYYIALKVKDVRANESVISNIVSGKTNDITEPATVNTLVMTAPLGNGSKVALKTAEVSSEYSSKWPKSNLIDKKASTVWASKQSEVREEVSIKIGWGALRSIGMIRIHPSRDYMELFPKDFEIQVSQDGYSYVTLAKEVSYTPFNGYNRWSFDGVLAKYARIVVTDMEKLSGEYMTMISEVEVYESLPDPTILYTRWLAPGDDGRTGRASTYELRYSKQELTSINFETGTRYLSVPSPSKAGELEILTIRGLEPETEYYVALKTYDEESNVSLLSNVVTAKTGISPPERIKDFRVITTEQTSALIEWTAPGENGNSGIAKSYDLRIKGQSITENNFDLALKIENIPVPSVAGTKEEINLLNLTAGTTYYAAIKTTDKNSNVSALSNVLVFETKPGPDTVNPGKIESLSVTIPDDNASVELSVVTASGSQFPDGAVENIVDEELESDWTTPPRESSQQESIVLDLGGLVDIEGINLTASRYYPMLFPVDFVLETSIDGNNYTQARAVANASAVSGEEKSYEFTVRSARYIKLLSSKSAMSMNGYYYVSLSEMGVVLAASNAGIVNLTWLATGDDQSMGTAYSYDIRYAEFEINEGNWDLATNVSGEPAPSAFGSLEVMTVSGLDSAVTYYFAVKAVDEQGNNGDISNVASVLTD